MSVFGQFSGCSGFSLIAMVLVIGWLLLRSQRHFAKLAKDSRPIVRTERPAPQRPAHRLAQPDDVARWEVHMHEVARELSGELDSKMGVLQELILQANRAAGRLETALAVAQATEEPAAPSETDAIGPPSSHEQSWETSSRPASQAEALKSPGRTEVSPHDSPTSTDSASEKQPADRRYEQIYTLADYGFDTVEVAQKVDMPVGEVELILGLRPKR